LASELGKTLQRGRFERNRSEDSVDPAALPENVAAKPSHARHGVGEVQIVVGQKLRPFLITENFQDERFGLLGIKRRGIGLEKASVDPHLDGQPHVDVHITGADLHGLGQDAVKLRFGARHPGRSRLARLHNRSGCDRWGRRDRLGCSRSRT
jgi:hypothetical protein